MIKNSDEIKSALELLGIPYKLLDEERIKLIGNDVLKKYSKGSTYSYPLWDNLSSFWGVDFQFAWKWFFELLKNKEVILFFDLADDTNMFELKNGGCISSVMDNSFGMTIYVTNSKVSWLYCYNNDGSLVACGEAKEELKQYVVRNKISARTICYP